MKKGNIVQEKSNAFAVNIVAVCRKLMEDEKEYILSKQLFRPGTSIGANKFESLMLFLKTHPNPSQEGISYSRLRFFPKINS